VNANSVAARSGGDARFLDRPVMRDPQAEDELSRRGYVVVDLLDADEVAELRDFYDHRAAQGDLNPEGAYNPEFAEFTTMNNRSDFRQVAYEKVVSVTAAATARHLLDYRPIVANFVNKPTEGGLVPIHQNMSLVDEEQNRSVSVWIALVDCDRSNGTIQFVDRSHLVMRGRRGTWAYQQFAGVDDGTIDQLFHAVPVRAGQAIVLDDAVVHYSAPNRSDRRRLAIQLVMIPAECPALYFEVAEQREDELELDVLEIGPEFFFDFWNGVGDHRHAQRVDRVVAPNPVHGAAALRIAAGSTGPGPGRWRRLLDRGRRAWKGH